MSFFFVFGGEQNKNSPYCCRCLYSSPFAFKMYLLDRRDGEPQRLGLLRGPAELVRGEDEARGAGRPGGEAVGEGLMIVFEVVSYF